VFMIAQDYQFAMTRFWTFGLPTLCGSVNAAQTNSTLRIEDFPLLWLEGNNGAGYYDSYKGDTFEISGSGCVYGGNVSDYAAITSIDLFNQRLTTNFNTKLLSKFFNLEVFRVGSNDNYNNNISVIETDSLFFLKTLAINYTLITTLNLTNNLLLEDLSAIDVNLGNFDISQNLELVNVNIQNTNRTVIDITLHTKLKIFNCVNPLLSEINVLNNLLLEDLRLQFTRITNLDIVNNSQLMHLRTHNAKLNNVVNSDILIKLNGFGLSNGYFNSSIHGGGSLTTAGAAAKTSLQGKGWNIVGL